MERETLKVTWKIIRRSGQACSRTPETYCTYIAENHKQKHKLKTIEGTKLFNLLENTVVSKLDKYDQKVLIDGMYRNGKLLYVTNFRTA